MNIFHLNRINPSYVCTIIGAEVNELEDHINKDTYMQMLHCLVDNLYDSGLHKYLTALEPGTDSWCMAYIIHQRNAGRMPEAVIETIFPNAMDYEQADEALIHLILDASSKVIADWKCRNSSIETETDFIRRMASQGILVRSACKTEPETVIAYLEKIASCTICVTLSSERNVLAILSFYKDERLIHQFEIRTDLPLEAQVRDAVNKVVNA